jgi:hypothetical protein
MKSQTKPSVRKRLIERIALALLLLGICSVAIAKLPPPTAEEQAQVAAQKDKAAADAQTEKALLEKAQDKIASRYLAEHKGHGAPTSTGSSGDSGSSDNSEVPSAALNSRPNEKAGSYNEAVTPQSAPRASSGSKNDSASAPQGNSNSSGK